MIRWDLCRDYCGCRGVLSMWECTMTPDCVACQFTNYDPNNPPVPSREELEALDLELMTLLAAIPSIELEDE